MAELIPLLYHSSGWYAGGGAVLPPNPVATGAENDGGAENGCAIGTGAGTLGVIGTLGVKDWLQLPQLSLVFYQKRQYLKQHPLRYEIDPHLVVLRDSIV